MTGNSTALASHIVLLAIIVLISSRYVRAGLDGTFARVAPHEWAPTVVLACAGLGIERLYYALARILRDQGVDLWSLHPAPAILSLIVGMGLYALTLPVLLHRHRDPSVPRGRIGAEWSALLGLWLLVAIGAA